MNINGHPSSLTAASSRAHALARSITLPAIAAGLLLAGIPSSQAALTFIRGTATAVGIEQYSSSPDSAILTGAFTAPGFISGGLFIPENRIQYDIINSDQGQLTSWTINYSPAVGPLIIGACTPLGYVTPTGTIVPEGGSAYTTLFNAGFGVYNYNTGAPWTIDYEPDHITFTATGVGVPSLPPADGIGCLAPTSYLPSFSIEYDPSLTYGPVPATAVVGTTPFTGVVFGPLPPSATNCITIQCSNIVALTCGRCTNVNYNVHVTDNCCPNFSVQYFPPPTHCFPKNSTNVVEVVVTDTCGNGATNFFTVTVLQDPNCVPTNPCINIVCSNIVAFTCDSCTPVPYNAFAIDTCCSAAPPTLVFNPPPGFCFPVGTTTPVSVIAFDQCGNTASNSFLVTVAPGRNCSSNGCISLQTSNVVVYTCSNSASVTYPTPYTDRCCSNSSIYVSPPSGSSFPLGTKPVMVIVSDQCGNSLSNVFTVTVIQDTNAPVINCPPAIYLPCGSGTGFAIMPDESTNSALTAGNLEPVTVSQSIPPGTHIYGMTFVTLTVSNGCGETASCTVPVYALPDPALSVGTNGPAGSGFPVLTWPPAPAQLQMSQDLIHWTSLAAGTNQPYTVSNPPPNAYFRLMFNYPTR